MGDGDELDLQRTDLDGLAVLDLAHVGLREQPGFLDAVAGEAEGECGTVDRQRIVTEIADAVVIASRYWMAPTWSSWPWVSTSAEMRCAFSRR